MGRTLLVLLVLAVIFCASANAGVMHATPVNDTVADVMYIRNDGTYTYARGHEDLTQGTYVLWVMTSNADDLQLLKMRARAQGVVETAIDLNRAGTYSVYDAFKIRQEVSDDLQAAYMADPNPSVLADILVQGQSRLKQNMLGDCSQDSCWICLSCSMADCCVCDSCHCNTHNALASDYMGVSCSVSQVDWLAATEGVTIDPDAASCPPVCPPTCPQCTPPCSPNPNPCGESAECLSCEMFVSNFMTEAACQNIPGLIEYCMEEGAEFSALCALVVAGMCVAYIAGQTNPTALCNMFIPGGGCC